MPGWPRARRIALAAIVPLLVVAAVVAVGAGLQLSRAAGWDESAELIARLDIAPGTTVADVGAGDGWLAVEVARHVGAGGRVFATELDRDRLEEIRAAVAEAGLTNVTVIEAHKRETGLPAACCEVVYLRAVYHHVTAPAALNASLFEAVAPSGRLAVIDFEPGGVLEWLGWGSARDGHGIPPDTVIAEVEQAGFELVDREEHWGRRNFLLVFRRPGSPPASPPGRRG